MSYNNSEDYFESNEFKATLKRFEEAERSGQEIILLILLNITIIMAKLMLQ